MALAVVFTQSKRGFVSPVRFHIILCQTESVSVLLCSFLVTTVFIFLGLTQDCETFGMPEMLIEKDPSLEKSIQFALRQNLYMKSVSGVLKNSSILLQSMTPS